MEEIKREIQGRYNDEEIDLLQLLLDMGKHFRHLWWLCVPLV